MAFDAKPQTWIGAAARAETGITISVLSVSTTTFRVANEDFAQFLKNDDPVYFDNSFGTIVANEVNFLRDVAVSGGYTQFKIANKPSWEGTQTNRTFTNGITKSLLLPSRIWFTIQNSGLTNLPAGLSTLSAANANRTTGDIRYFFLELPKMLLRLWNAKLVADRPKRVRADSHDFIASSTMATRNYTIELDLAYSTTAVATEPAV
jgi:hypothetical protein